jgi:hypothetical protein
MHHALRIALLSSLLFVAVGGSGCATTNVPGDGTVVVSPGESFKFDNGLYRMEQVGDDYVLRREIPEEGEKGEVSGWVDEVFRVGRYQLHKGSWEILPRLPGVLLVWKGGDSFTLSRVKPSK